MDRSKTKIALLSIAMGFWLIAVPLTFEFKSKTMLCSDIFSGIAVIILGVFSLSPRRSWSAWLIGAVGIWLQLAPLVFWAPATINYLNDTLIGTILIAFSFSLAANQRSESESGPAIPEGWSYNPSSWLPRLLTVCLALLCWTFSRYLAAYQLGYIDQLWDPVFKEGSLDVITSRISRDFPVADAGLGALCYTLEFLLGWHGSSRRWYRMPWLVLSFGILVVPVGFTSIVLIILQPVVVGAWCFWCLAIAACMLTMILLAGSELIATISMLKRAVRQGSSFWTVLWKGGKDQGQVKASPPRQRRKGQLPWGFTACWNLIILSLLGAYLMLSPHLYSTRGPLATWEYIIGPLLVTFSIISMVEVYRAARWIHILLGPSLFFAALLWPSPDLIANWNAAILGLLIPVLSIPRGTVRERYGSWDPYIF